MSEKRIEWIDILKCVGIYLVVLGHTSVDSTPDTLRFYIYSFHMPMFFAISGMTFYLQCKNREYTLGGMVKNKVKGLIWPYITLSVIAIPIWIFNFRIIPNSYANIWSVIKMSIRTTYQLIKGMFFSNEEVYTSSTNAMWFCLTLFLSLIIFWLIRKVTKDKEILLGIILLVAALIDYKFVILYDHPKLPWHLNTVPVAILCVYFGWIFMKNINLVEKLLGNKTRQLIFLVLFFVLGYICAYNNEKISMATNRYGNFALFLGSFIFFSLVCVIVCKNIPLFSIFELVGRNTIVILAFHAAIFRFMDKFSVYTNYLLAEQPILVGTAAFVILIPVCWLFENYLPFLIGRKKKKA